MWVARDSIRCLKCMTLPVEVHKQLWGLIYPHFQPMQELAGSDRPQKRLQPSMTLLYSGNTLTPPRVKFVIVRTLFDNM